MFKRREVRKPAERWREAGGGGGRVTLTLREGWRFEDVGCVGVRHTHTHTRAEGAGVCR